MAVEHVIKAKYARYIYDNFNYATIKNKLLVYT